MTFSTLSYKINGEGENANGEGENANYEAFQDYFFFHFEKVECSPLSMLNKVPCLVTWALLQ